MATDCDEGRRVLPTMKFYVFVISIVPLILAPCLDAQFSTVPTPPYFTKQPPKELLYQVATQADETDKPFLLECEAKGYPEPAYTWYRNEILFQADAYDDRINKQPNRGTLVFVTPSDIDEGIYQCNATNIHGTAMSNTVNVKKSVLNSFPEQPMKFITVEEGDPYTMACNAPSGYPKPSIFWIIQSEGGALRTINSSRITVDPEGNLHFSNVTKDDANDENMYACSANSMFRNEYKLGNRIMLLVNSGTGMTQAQVQPTKQYVSPPNIAALRGKKLKLSCIYGGTPIPQVLWRRKNGQLPKGRHTYDNFGKTLIIKRMEFEDQGTYECEVSNGVGPAKSHAMSVSVQAAPYWLKVPDSINKAEEEDVEFECEARGVPEPRLQWFANGVPIQKVKYNPRLNVQGTVLTITNLVKTDTAVFQCNASNSHGYVFTNIYLNVISLPPSILVRPDPLRQAVVGSTIIIPCKASGAPLPEMTWTKDGNQLTGGRYEILKDGLQIQGVMKLDEGTYKCVATNKLSRDQAEGQLVVKSKTVITSQPEDFEVAAGKPVTFRCSAVADDSLPLEMIWLRNGEPIDYELQPRMKMTDDYSLTISNTFERDSGTYTCRAKTPLDSQEVSATLTVQDVPNKPIMIGVKCDSVTAMVQWRPNGDNRASITNFIIQYNTSFTPDTWVTAFSKIPSSDSKFKISMTPYANYTFRVIAENKIGPSVPSDKSGRCTTPGYRPYKNPDNVVGYGTTPTNLVIQWTPMPLIEHNGPKFQYKIFWKRADLPDVNYEWTIIKSWTTSEVVLERQPTFKPYLIKVEAHNSRGQAHVTAPVVIGYSGEDVPLSAPGNFTMMNARDAKSRWFKWEPVPSDSLRGHFRGYKIQTWTPDIGEDNLRELTVPSEITKTLVDILIPDSENFVRVLAYNGAYDGPPSKTINFRTPEGRPGAVSKFDAFPIGSSILHLRWEKPEEPNGKLTGYKIYYQKVKGTELGELNEKKPPVTDPDQLSTRLARLEAATKYRITVKATTSKGEGDPFFIEVVTRSNFSGKPGKPDFRLVSLPEEDSKGVVKVILIPDVNGNPGSSFEVQYRRSGESQWADVNLDPNADFVLLRQLDLSTDYEIRVVASEKQEVTYSNVQIYETSNGSVLAAKSDDDGIIGAAWLIGMLCAIAVLLLLLFLVCLLKRNRGGKYSVHKKEAAQGRDLDYLEDGFNEFSKPVDDGNPKGSHVSLNSSVKNPESETDSMAEYGEGEAGQFTEDGSFIGQYGTKNRKERSDQDTTSPSALATFV